MTAAETERALLSDQLITAEQDERRRLALFLHDGPVQSLSGIALMLDGGLARGRGRTGSTRRTQVLGVGARAAAARRSARCATSRSTSSRSCCATRASGRPSGSCPAARHVPQHPDRPRRRRGGAPAENAQVALYQIIREALHHAIRRGPPTRISVRRRRGLGRHVEAVISDDGAGERRRASFDAIAERARTINGRLSVELGRRRRHRRPRRASRLRSRR